MVFFKPTLFLKLWIAWNARGNVHLTRRGLSGERTGQFARKVWQLRPGDPAGPAEEGNPQTYAAFLAGQYSQYSQIQFQQVGNGAGTLIQCKAG
jgi:hypothetical protein